MPDETAAHPPMTRNNDGHPEEPHIDPDGMCACIGSCCTGPEPLELCICPECGGEKAGCRDHGDK